MEKTIAVVSGGLGIYLGLASLEGAWAGRVQANEAQALEGAISEQVQSETIADGQQGQIEGEPMMPALSEDNVQSPQDPLNSPHPVPWSWVLETQESMKANGQTGIRYYRSPALVSPDGGYAAYSRVQLHVEPDAYRNRVDSVLFVENMKNGSLGVITPSSPFAEVLGTGTSNPSPASISLLVPVSWNADSSQLLAREFDGIFNSSDLTDYAIVWDRDRNQTRILAPEGMPDATAVLMGWSSRQPGEVLFQAGELGEEVWALWTVGEEGNTTIALEDEPLVIGETVVHSWNGPQAYWTPKSE